MIPPVPEQHEQVAPAKRRRKRAILLLRIIGSASLMALLLWQANLAVIWQTWRTANLWLIAFAVVLQFGGVAVSAAKWGVLLRARGHTQPFRWLVETYLIGQFANNVLPTTVGGDAARIAQLARRIGSVGQASASVLVDRVTGFLALSLIGCAALVWNVLNVDPLNSPLLMNVALIGAAGAAVVSLALARVAPQIGRLRAFPIPQRVVALLERGAHAINAYVPRDRTLALVLCMSLAFQWLWVTLHAVLGRSLGIEAPLFVYALAIPLIDILGLAPIFINNIGVRELVLTLYLSQVGVNPAAAVALALLVFSVRLVVSLFGGLVLLFDGSLIGTSSPVRAADSAKVVSK